MTSMYDIFTCAMCVVTIMLQGRYSHNDTHRKFFTILYPNFTVESSCTSILITKETHILIAAHRNAISSVINFWEKIAIYDICSELRTIDLSTSEPMYSAGGYFQSIDSPRLSTDYIRLKLLHFCFMGK